ncbi:MAG TPA: sugar glycosyltransferase [Buttiauxella sp.]|uniref:sugar glycosyltransferase n=1 Tax=Buttiauxella sp. TaxID=1972222 RepID=UPI002B47D2A1|nr:sugar glycosyltransferase [Buttiauxella sp.]HKM97138.1 sugar glycosyltransferase [Buttiauxella sp.]
MGTFTKQIYRYTHPRTMRHNENLWPYVKIQRNDFGAISKLSYKRDLIPLLDLSALKDSFEGDALLTATGPSIKKIDFSKLSDLTAVGVNGAWHLNELVNFSIYIIVDMLFIDKKTELLKQIVDNKDLILFTTMHGVVKLVDNFSLKNIKCKLSIIEDKCSQIFKPQISSNEIYSTFCSQPQISFLPESKNIAFNYEIRNGVFDAGTVVYWALQILSFLGFKKIYIAGLDMTNFSSPRFYETTANMLPSFLDEKLHDIIIPAFTLASQALSNKNIDVINLSLDSAIPSYIFTKLDYRDAFKE